MSILVPQGAVSLNPELKARPKIIGLVDLENILFSLPVMHPDERFLLEAAFEKFIEWLDGIGEVKSIFVFGSEKSIFGRRANLYKLNWFSILCPRIKRWVPKSGYQFGSESEENQEKDTSDATIMRFWELLHDMPGWDILCLGSGDIDFAPLAKETRRRKKDMAIAAATEKIKLSSQFEAHSVLFRLY
ncbi:MAG: NYN domain-containing protein [Candidatus Nealsonbacteria bacterium]|nr:NYN domain-containing protein [Candidatus Nealsonbacteria bacterium]